MNAHPAFRFAPRWAILIPRLRRLLSAARLRDRIPQCETRRGAGTPPLSVAFADSVGRLPHSMRPSAQSTRKRRSGIAPNPATVFGNRFVSGHGFSRAADRFLSNRALAPEVLLPQGLKPKELVAA
jgi:hypothetical protein